MRNRIQRGPPGVFAEGWQRDNGYALRENRKFPERHQGDAVRGFAYSLLFVVIAAIPILIIIGIALIGMVVIVGLICRVVRIVLVCIVIKL